MIVYKATKEQYLQDVESNRIHLIIEECYIEKTGGSVGNSELMSWKNSNDYMYRVMIDPDIPIDVTVVIEFKIGNSRKRIDFLIAGKDDAQIEQVILIELKQWSDATITDMDGMVNSFVGKGYRDLVHPSYQVWSYTVMLENFNSVVYTEGIKLRPCAYLHNYAPNGVMTHEMYSTYTQKAPVFLQQDSSKLKEYIKTYISKGDTDDAIGRIDRSELRPSKQLAESILSMLKGNEEFILIDEQKIAYENILKVQRRAEEDDQKRVIIIEGEPGTGKSVIAINLLVKAISERKNAVYVTKTQAPRDVYSHYLKSEKKRSEIDALFSGSASFTGSKEDEYDLLIVDEAHRLLMKNRYNKQSYNQAKEIMKASKTSVFFVDDRQVVHISDVGRKANLKAWAEEEGYAVDEYKLESQFRCAGSDDYLNWLDHLLQIDDEGLKVLDTQFYDFKVFDSPTAMRKAIEEKNKEKNRARIVAGYCYPWISDKDRSLDDIQLEDGFSMQWNFRETVWVVGNDSVNQVGSIHTSQGMDIEHVGVIIGKDMRFEGGEIVTDFLERAPADRTVFGMKKMFREDPVAALEQADIIIKNTYRTLMTRGMKGCYVYCEDEKLNEYIKTRIRLAHPEK